MKHGYVIIARDYKAEICEFETLTIIAMPDKTRLYFIHTKYGDEYFQESELSATRESLVEECEALNKALLRGHNGNESVFAKRK